VVGILDVLVTTIAAHMTGDELVVEVDADPVGIGFDCQPAVSVGGGHGILIGVQRDATLNRTGVNLDTPPGRPFAANAKGFPLPKPSPSHTRSGAVL